MWTSYSYSQHFRSHTVYLDKFQGGTKITIFEERDNNITDEQQKENKFKASEMFWQGLRQNEATHKKPSTKTNF